LIARGDLAKDHGGRQDDEERAAHPESEADADELAGGVQAPASLTEGRLYPSPVSRRFRLTLLCLALAAAALRLYRLDHFSYGLDEILQAYWINGTWQFLWRSLDFDAFHPPLDYIVGRLLETFGPADAVRKLPAVLWGAGTVVAFGALLRRRAGETAGLVGAALLAFAPFHVRYSQELRPYSLALLLLCLSLLALDRFLEAPTLPRLCALYLACLATAYTLYTAAFVLALAAAALLIEDAFAPDPGRRRASLRFLAWSPAFVFALWLAYLPWWPVLLKASQRPAMAARPPLSLARADRILSYFAFAPNDGFPLGPSGYFFLALAAAGAWISVSRRGLRFLTAWGPGGFAAIEILGQLHPHFDVSRRFLPAAPGMTALAALPLAALLARPVTRQAGALLLAAVLVFDAKSLRVYFREGRADWRVLADYLRREAAPSERVFTENQYAQLCTAFYLAGPRWLYQVVEKVGTPARDVPNLEGQIERLHWAWKPGARAWLVLAGEPQAPPLRRWAQIFPRVAFPPSEGAQLHRLDPELRARALGSR
jgi:mannosyltransferase